MVPNPYHAKYSFIYEDVFLIAEINPLSGRQFLIMQKVNPKDGRILLEDRIQCIHTAIIDLSPEDLEQQVDADEFEENLLQIRSSENNREVDLEIDEKFFAFKSWVQGIAEAGIAAITIQTDIEQYAHLMTPIANRIFNFLLHAKLDFIEEFVAQMENDCVFEGEFHKPSINVNVMKILNIMILEEKEAWNIWRDRVTTNYEWNETWQFYLVKNFDGLLKAILQLTPSVNVFLEKPKFEFILTLDAARSLPDFDEVIREAVQFGKRVFSCYLDDETGLKTLDLSLKGIDDMERVIGLEKIPDLETLHLEGNKIREIRGLDSLGNLKRLYLTNNSIQEISGLDSLQKLQILYLTYNPIKKIAGLENLVNLRELYLFQTSLTRIEGLKNLHNLEVLGLSSCEIRQIDGLSSLKRLKRLNLGWNLIERVEGLEGLDSLEELDLFGNLLEHVPTFDDLSYLPRLTRLSTEWNPRKLDSGW